MVLNVNGLTRGILLAGLLLASPAAPAGRALADSDGLPDEALGKRIVPVLLLSRVDVREDLGLSETQTKDAEQAITAFYERALAQKGKKGLEAEAARKRIDREQVAWINLHLTAEQRARLLQIDLQWEGPSTIVTRPVIVENVGLTPTQRTTLLEAVKTRNAARAIKSFSMADEDALWEKTKATLSSTQLVRYEAILGKKFKIRVAVQDDSQKVVR